MKKTLLILFLCLSNQLSFSQDFKKVDQIIKYYPEIQTIEQLAQKINYDFKNSNLEKVRAIYTWIGLNIKYDYMLFNSSLLRHPEFIAYNDEHDLDWIKRRKIKEVAQSTFEARKGLCTGYAYLFQRICNLMDIPNELIYGYTRTSFRDIGYIPKTKNHVWNSVKIDNRWLLMDLTFGSGYMYKDVWQKKFNQDYFDASKDLIKLTHFATDSKWNTYLDQKNLQEFCLDPFFKNAYLKSNIEIIKPTVGEIVINKKEKIRLSIKKLPNVDNIRYSYLHDDKIYDARIDNKQDQTTDIYFKNPKRDTSLHIYINNELALEYKVKIL